MKEEALPVAGLAGLCALLTLGVVLELAWPVANGREMPDASPLLGTLGEAHLFIPTVTTELRKRPLFTATRRSAVATPPASVEAPKLPAVPPPLPATQLSLLGIVEGPSARIAVIRIQNVAQPVRVSEGAKIDRWEVRHIFADHVTLASDGIEQDLAFPPGHPAAPRQSVPSAGR